MYDGSYWLWFLPLGSQQFDPPNPTTEPEPIGGDNNVLLSKSTKKRKPNSSGKKTTYVVWDHFTRSLESSYNIATCNHCGKQFRCDPKTHGTSNLNYLKKLCPKYPLAIISDPNQTTFTFKSSDNSSLLKTSQKYNVEDCRKTFSMFVIVDEQPFKVVKGEGFKNLCKK